MRVQQEELGIERERVRTEAFLLLARRRRGRRGARDGVLVAVRGREGRRVARRGEGRGVCPSVEQSRTWWRSDVEEHPKALFESQRCSQQETGRRAGQSTEENLCIVIHRQSAAQSSLPATVFSRPTAIESQRIQHLLSCGSEGRGARRGGDALPEVIASSHLRRARQRVRHQYRGSARRTRN